VNNEIKEKAREYAVINRSAGQFLTLDHDVENEISYMAFIAGAASRDKEIEVLKAQLNECKNQRDLYINLSDYGDKAAGYAINNLNRILAALEQK